MSERVRNHKAWYKFDIYVRRTTVIKLILNFLKKPYSHLFEFHRSRWEERVRGRGCVWSAGPVLCGRVGEVVLREKGDDERAGWVGTLLAALSVES